MGIRNTLYRAYLEDFYAFCQNLGGVTADVMTDILEFEADRRAINITMHSFNTELSVADREKLYPTIGVLYPEGTDKLKSADEPSLVKAAMEPYGQYKSIFQQESVSERSLEELFFEYEVDLNK